MSVTKLAEGKYQARWRDPDKRQRTKIFPTKGEAEDHLADIRVRVRAGTYSGHRAGAVTLTQYAEERWLPYVTQTKRRNTVETYEAHWRNHVRPQLGSRKIASIRRPDTRAFAAYLSLRAELAPATVATVFAVLRSIMQLAVEDDDVPVAANPCFRVQLPELPHRVLTPLEPAQVRRLAECITMRYEVTVWLAAGCGLREGEVFGLQARRVDFLRRRVHVVEQLQNGEPAPLKTKTSRRIVPADDMVLEQVAGHLAEWPASGGELVLTNRCGRPVQRNSFGHCWREAVTEARLPAGTRFHDLRHFYASALIRAGLNVKEVQSRLGHATASETLETYAHLWPDDADRGRGAIETMFTQTEIREAR